MINLWLENELILYAEFDRGLNVWKMNGTEEN